MPGLDVLSNSHISPSWRYLTWENSKNDTGIHIIPSMICKITKRCQETNQKISNWYDAGVRTPILCGIPPTGFWAMAYGFCAIWLGMAYLRMRTWNPPYGTGKGDQTTWQTRIYHDMSWFAISCKRGRVQKTARIRVWKEIYSSWYQADIGACIHHQRALPGTVKHTTLISGRYWSVLYTRKLTTSWSASAVK